MERGAARPSARYQLVTIGLTTLMVATALGSLSQFWHMGGASGSIFLISLLAALVGWAVWRAPLLTAGVVLGALAGVAIWRHRDDAVRTYLHTLQSEGITFFEQMRQYRWETTFGASIGGVFLWLVAIALAVFIVREALRRGSAFWSVLVGILLFGIQWAWYFDLATGYFSWYLMTAFLLWAAAASSRRDAEWLASGRKVGYGSQFHSVAVWVVVASLFGAVLPTNWRPIDIGQAAERLQERFPALQRLRGTLGPGLGGRFQLKMSGFSLSTLELGGQITLDQSVSFQLVTQEPLPGTAYLRGSTATTYTGRGWEVSDAPTMPYPETGVLPSLYDPSVPRLYVNFRIEPVISLGSSIFHVLEPTKIEGVAGLQRDEDGNIWADRPLTQARPYRVDSRWILYNASQIRERAAGEPGAGWAPYLQLPRSLPQRVYDLTHEVTAAEPTAIDKALAIEAYLRQMPYTLEMPQTPSGVDFVDHFLFEQREGYCVYFASAMVLMLRQVGIPARWVQGFAVPADGEQMESDDKLIYPVRNSLAHAWVEAYFPGFGWVTFDPTPRADLPMIGREAPVEEQADSPLYTSDSAELFPDDSLSTEPTGERGLSGGTAPGAASDQREWPAWMRWAVGALALLGLLGWAVYRRLRAQERLRSTLPGEMLQESWEKVAWLLGLFGFGRKEHQTPLEYAQELGGALPSLAQPARQSAADYAAARYGPSQPAEQAEAITRAQTLWEQADELLFERVGWAKYLWRRLF